MFCAYCGKEIEEHSKFCPFCGNPVPGMDSETGKEEALKNGNPVMNTAETIENTVKDTRDEKAEKILENIKKTAKDLTSDVKQATQDFTSDVRQAAQEKNAVGFFTKNKYKNTKILIVIVFALAVLIGVFKQIGVPGSEVRDAYLSQYSNVVTVGKAFDDFFDKGKWSTYKEGDYSYVVFTGVCELLEERVDVRILFKITGENFIVDSLEVNGQIQDDLMLYSLLQAVYEYY